MLKKDSFCNQWCKSNINSVAIYNIGIWVTDQAACSDMIKKIREALHHSVFSVLRLLRFEKMSTSYVGFYVAYNLPRPHDLNVHFCFYKLDEY